MVFRYSLSLVSLVLLGCQHKPVTAMAYKLVRQGETPVLVPPTDSQGVVRIPKARQDAPKGDCNISGSVVSLEWKGKTANFRLIPPRESTAAVEALEKFRHSLTSACDRGCYTPEEGKRLLGAAAEHFTLPSATTFGLRYGAYSQSGYVDITSEFVLEAVTPLANGFEAARYAVSQGRIRLLSVNGASAAHSVSREWLKFPEAALQFRLIFLISKSAEDHDAVLLGAPSVDALDKATPFIQAQPEEACRLRGVNYVCALVPASSALNPQFQVRANGALTYIALNATVREALGTRGAEMTEAPPTLRIRRPFEGQPIPVKFEGPEILNMVLLPGDELVW